MVPGPSVGPAACIRDVSTYCTVSVMEVECVSVPEVPVIIIVVVPFGVAGELLLHPARIAIPARLEISKKMPATLQSGFSRAREEGAPANARTNKNRLGARISPIEPTA